MSTTARIVIILLIVSGAFPVFESAKVDKKICRKKDGLFPKPNTMCKGYYKCTNWVPVEKKCSDGERFNSNKNVCDWEELFPCFDKPKSKECPKDNGRFLKPGTNCKKYYDCCNGKPTEKICSGDQLFNPSKGKCEWPELYTCIESITTRIFTTRKISITSTINTLSTPYYPSTSTPTSSQPTNPSSTSLKSTTPAPTPSESTTLSSTGPPATFSQSTATPSTSSKPSTSPTTFSESTELPTTSSQSTFNFDFTESTNTPDSVNSRSTRSDDVELNTTNYIHSEPSETSATQTSSISSDDKPSSPITLFQTNSPSSTAEVTTEQVTTSTRAITTTMQIPTSTRARTTTEQIPTSTRTRTTTEQIPTSTRARTTPEQTTTSTTRARTTTEKISTSTRARTTTAQITTSTRARTTTEQITTSTTRARTTTEQIPTSTRARTTPEQISTSTRARTTIEDGRGTTPDDTSVERDFICPERFGYFPHPTNKHKFIGCVDGQPRVLICPSDLIYNDKLRMCVYE